MSLLFCYLKTCVNLLQSHFLTSQIKPYLSLIQSPLNTRCLFKKTPLKKLVEVQSNADPVRKNEYLACLTRHEQLSKIFFKFGLNEQGQPRAENFEEIRNDLFEKRKIIKLQRSGCSSC